MVGASARRRGALRLCVRAERERSARWAMPRAGARLSLCCLREQGKVQRRTMRLLSVLPLAVAATGAISAAPMLGPGLSSTDLCVSIVQTDPVTKPAERRSRRQALPAPSLTPTRALSPLVYSCSSCCNELRHVAAHSLHKIAHDFPETEQFVSTCSNRLNNFEKHFKVS